MKKDDTIVYPPEAGPQAAYQKVVVRREEDAPPSKGPRRLGWFLLLLGGLFWGGLLWMYGSGTDWMEPVRVFDAAPAFCLPVLYSLGGLAVMAAYITLVRGSFLPAMLLLIGGPVVVALCLVSGTLLRIQFGKLVLPGAPLAEAAGPVNEIFLTNKDGWEIKAVPVSLEGDRLKLKVDGKPKEIPFSSLNEASQRKVKEFSASHSSLKHIP